MWYTLYRRIAPAVRPRAGASLASPAQPSLSTITHQSRIVKWEFPTTLLGTLITYPTANYGYGLPPMNYNVAAAAHIVGVPPNTLRNWLVAYREYLSPSCNPGPNIERRIDDHDLAVLKLVSSMRRAGIPQSDVVKRLGETTVTVGEIVIEPSPMSPESLPVPTGDATTSLATISVVSDLDVRLRAVEARQAAQSWRSTPALWLAVGVVLGAVIGATIVIMALQLMR